MADLSITVASVAWSSGGICRDYNASTTITAGQSVYLTSSNTWALARATTATLAGNGTRTGIALHGSLAGQPLAVQESGLITIGATLTVGTLYVVSATLGGIAPFADLASTNKINIFGIGSTSTLLDMTYKGAYTGGYTGLAVP